MNEDLVKRAAQVLDSKKIIVVATTGKDGQPWNSPVAGFRFPGELIFYWTSWRENQHSRNIRENNKVFIVVFDAETAEGVYFLANTYEINDEQEALSAARVFRNDKYNPSDGREYIGDDKPRNIYKAVPAQVWMNSDKSDASGKFLHDIRIEISLDKLKSSVK